MADSYLDDDIINLYKLGKDRKKENLVATLFWGDRVNIVPQRDGEHVVELWLREWDPKDGKYRWKKQLCALPPQAKFRQKPLLKVRFIDVGQGDATIIMTPKDKVVLVDGGEERHLLYYIQKAFSHVLRTGPLHCNAIVVTHGDADHFEGLTKLLEKDRKKGIEPLVTVDFVYHNGLVKRSTTKDLESFGEPQEENGTKYVKVVEDLLEVPDHMMSDSFKRWKAALARLKKHNATVKVKRLEFGIRGAFDFLSDENIQIDVLGPITDDVKGKRMLRFLKAPRGGLSASHTINGHSVVLKLTYRNVRFLFGADLNIISEERLLEEARKKNISLRSEILKVPHHGSDEFTPKIIEAIRPVVSVISSGDENEAREYIHPRAGLVGSLGKFSRENVDKPLIYVTEMVAFFAKLGDITTTSKGGKKGSALIHNAYEKTQFGIVHVRTDGKRVLVATHSGRDDRKESYAFRVDPHGNIQFEEPSII